MVNKELVKEAIELLLKGIGEDSQREGLIDTPDRVARMYEELLAGYDDSADKHLSKLFPAIDNEMIMEKDIQFYSLY